MGNTKDSLPVVLGNDKYCKYEIMKETRRSTDVVYRVSGYHADGFEQVIWILIQSYEVVKQTKKHSLQLFTPMNLAQKRYNDTIPESRR